MNEHQHVANSIENERFELKNAANTLETAASSSKMLYKFHQNVANPLGKWEVPTPKCCKDSWNGSFSSKMLQIERTTGRKAGPKKNPKRKKISKTIPDPYFNWGLYDNSMNWEQAHIYWICLCLVDWRGRWNWPISYWKWPFSSLIYHDFPIQNVGFPSLCKKLPSGVSNAGILQGHVPTIQEANAGYFPIFFENNFPLTKNPQKSWVGSGHIKLRVPYGRAWICGTVPIKWLNGNFHGEHVTNQLT